jgi:hypothetical protein
MESIRDGQARDRCFYCALLYPELEACPQCGNRLHYQPASMSEDWLTRSDALVKQFQADPSASHAEAVLRLWHQYADDTEIAEGASLLSALRKAYEAEHGA